MRFTLFCWLSALMPAATFAGTVEIQLMDARGQPVPDAVVSLVLLEGVRPAVKPTPGIAIKQEKQEFIPYVTAITVGTSVILPNDDTVQHHVYSLSPAKVLDLPLYKPKSADTVTFERSGVVTLGCNIHDWMIAYVVVLDTPWFAQTAAAGTAAIKDVPEGRYRVEVWHPQLGAKVTREVTVAAEPSKEAFKLTLGPDRRIRRPADTKSGGYK